MGTPGKKPLWREKTEYKQYNPQTLEYIWDVSRNLKDYLPYERLYETLTPDQLATLIQDAKRLHWQALDLSNCELTSLPDTLGDLTELHILSLYWNRHLTALPDSIGQLTNLQSLNLRNTQLTALPDSIGQLTNLQYLYLSSTRLTALPDSIGQLTNLQYLSLRSTQLTALPDSMGQLKNLQYLNLRNTLLTALPDWLGQLTNLQKLGLQNCHLTAIPYSLVQLGLPFVVDDPLAYNCINLTDATPEEGDISLFGQPREVIEEYYRNRAAEAVNECKVIFLGDGEAGKSSLIERMVHNEFREGSLPTDGVKMTRWTAWPDKDNTPLTLDGKPLTLRLLDFGGQEIMHSMHRCFLTSHTVYVVVCESRNDTDIDKTAVRWMETIRSFAPDCPVILALNKSDLNFHVTVDETQLREINPLFMGSLRTSAKQENDPGVRQLIDQIFRAVPDCMSQMKGNRGFLGLKQELETMEENYILPEQFREKCERFAIRKDLRAGLLDWFQDLGVAYPYRITLQEVYVLNPAWMTNGIYRLILRTPSTGFLKHSTILETLETAFPGDISDTTYTAQEMEFILYIMRKFEISLCVTPDYALDGVEMIPLKLDKNTPEQSKAFPRADALHLRWEARYLPNNLIHRLIIRKYADLDTECVWRTGGWFRNRVRDCEALAVMTDGALDVYVSGKRDAKGYMDSFREEVLQILQTLNIGAEEYVYCTYNGKTGRIPLRHVIARRSKGREDIYLGDIDEDVPVDWILHENYMEKRIENARTMTVNNHYYGPVGQANTVEGSGNRFQQH